MLECELGTELVMTQIPAASTCLTPLLLPLGRPWSRRVVTRTVTARLRRPSACVTRPAQGETLLVHRCPPWTGVTLLP